MLNSNISVSARNPAPLPDWGHGTTPPSVRLPTLQEPLVTICTDLKAPDAFAIQTGLQYQTPNARQVARPHCASRRQDRELILLDRKGRSHSALFCVSTLVRGS